MDTNKQLKQKDGHQQTAKTERWTPTNSSNRKMDTNKQLKQKEGHQQTARWVSLKLIVSRKELSRSRTAMSLLRMSVVEIPQRKKTKRRKLTSEMLSYYLFRTV